MDLLELSRSHENNFKDFLFYDIEVFKDNALVVFKDIDKNTVGLFTNDEFYKIHNLIEGKVLVGYNNYHYDDYILSSMMARDSQKKIKALNDLLINTNLKSTVPLNTSIFSLDCFQQINVAKSSLKKVEANLGLSIEESSVPFDIDRPLNPKELNDTIEYCKHDVDATIDIFKLRWFSYFVPKLQILTMLPKDKQRMALRWNTTTITAQLLKGDAPKEGLWVNYRLDSSKGKVRTDLLSTVPSYVKELWDNAAKSLRDPTLKYEKKYTYTDYGCSFEFGQGGLHGVSLLQKKQWRNVKLLDVTSLYPNLIIILEALGGSTNTYKEIVDRRVKVKHTDKVLSNALKLVINATYGLLKNEYSKLYNPNAALSVCMYGQIALFDLCRRLATKGYTLINVNTDGVAFTGCLPDECFKQVQREWEEHFNLKLELSEFDTWIQKDVNNYVAIDKSGHIKVKGGDVNHYGDPSDYSDNVDLLHLIAGVNWTGTNTISIVDICIVEKLLHNKPVIETVYENIDKPILFQYILSPGRTYKGVIDENGNEYQRVNRVFACKDSVDSVLLKKIKPLEGLEEMEDSERFERAQYFPNAPKQMYVYNGDLSKFNNFKDIVDIDYYVQLAENKLNNFWT